MRESIQSDRDSRARRGQDPHEGPHNGSRSSRSSRNGRLSGNKAVEAAREYLLELTGRDAESVSGLSRSQEGWVVMLEVVELERVPRSTDILATYRVEVNGEGELMGYDRVHRYYRNQPGAE